MCNSLKNSSFLEILRTQNHSQRMILVIISCWRVKRVGEFMPTVPRQSPAQGAPVEIVRSRVSHSASDRLGLSPVFETMFEREKQRIHSAKLLGTFEGVVRPRARSRRPVHDGGSFGGAGGDSALRLHRTGGFRGDGEGHTHTHTHKRTCTRTYTQMLHLATYPLNTARHNEELNFGSRSENHLAKLRI